MITLTDLAKLTFITAAGCGWLVFLAQAFVQGGS